MDKAKRNHNQRGTKHRQGWRVIALAAMIAASMSLAGPTPALAAEDHVEPLGTGYQNVLVPKHRAIISFMNADEGITTFRGQSENVESDLSRYYDSNTIPSTRADLGVSGGGSRVFSQTQAFGIVPQTLTLAEEFMGQKTFDKVPSGVICTSYLTRLDGDGNNTGFWLELTGRSENGENLGRIGRVKVPGIKRPYYRYKFNADLSKVYAPVLDRSVAHNMVAWDWNKDGYTDWLVNYLTNPDGSKDHKNMKIALLFIDGKSLYDACRGSGSVRTWTGPWIEFTTGGNVLGGLTTKKPPNSIRMAVGDMDGDGNPEVGLYYTKVQGTGFAPNHDNHLKILRLTYTGTEEPPKWDFFYEKGSDVGQWHVQYDSVGIAMGDLDGDGYDEMAVLHGKTNNAGQSSSLYLDVYKIVNGRVEKVVKGENVGKTSKLANYSTPTVEASIADLDGDGIGELVYVHTEHNNASRLFIVINKWPVKDGVVVLSGGGNRKGYNLTNMDNGWVMDDNHARFSMDTGMFVYPDTEKVRHQIGLVSTLEGSDNKNGIRWGIFTWDDPSGLKLIAKGTKANGQMDGNLVPTITAADIDNDSMVLGEPNGFTVYDNIEPVFIVQAPPKHWDTITSGDGEQILDAFALLKGYSTSVTGKTADAQGSSTTKTSVGHWGASVAFTVAKNNFFKENAKVMDIGARYAGESASRKTESTTVVTTNSLTATAQYDDQIYYRANTHDVWRYPVLAPKSQAFVTSDGVTYRKFLQFIVPKTIDSSFAPTSGKDVDWYEPRHNGLNLFSYPRKLEQTRDYPQGASAKLDSDFWKDINGIVLAKSTGQIMGNIDNTSYNFTIEVKEHKDHLSSLKNTISGFGNLNLPARGVAFKKILSTGLTGDYSYGTDSITTSDRSKLGGITVSWPGLASYKSPSGLLPGEQAFTVDAAIYTSDGGALSVAYAVSNLYKKFSAIWGDASPYKNTADPALNLPRQWVFSDNKWQANPFPADANRIRGLVFDEAAVGAKSGVSGQALPINTQVHGSMRVFNYSFVPTGKVTVTFMFQPIKSISEDPDITKATPLGSKTILSIPGRDSGINDNWQDLRITFTTKGEQTIGYLHVSLTTDGGNLQTNNDHGQLLVGVYDPEKLSVPPVESLRMANGPRFLVAQEGGKSLTIVPNSLSIRPLNADGSFGSETTSLDPGETAVVQATIRFTDNSGAQQKAILHSSVYLRNGSGFVAQRAVPMLQNGENYVVQMLYTAPDTPQYVPFQMILASPVLPATKDANPAGRTTTKVLTVGDPGGSGGGCSVGLTPGVILLGLPLLLLLRKR